MFGQVWRLNAGALVPDRLLLVVCRKKNLSKYLTNCFSFLYGFSGAKHLMDTRKVLLVGWDGADWKIIHPLLDAGKMPNLTALIENGVMGNLSSLRPELSPMLWTSIATGKRPYKHGPD